MTIKYVDYHLPLQDPPKFTQIGILGSKTCHLAAQQHAPRKSSNHSARWPLHFVRQVHVYLINDRNRESSFVPLAFGFIYQNT
jgi:hypothetical protein